jgi:hypothetical protein
VATEKACGGDGTDGQAKACKGASWRTYRPAEPSMLGSLRVRGTTSVGRLMADRMVRRSIAPSSESARPQSRCRLPYSVYLDSPVLAWSYLAGRWDRSSEQRMRLKTQGLKPRSPPPV